MKFVKFSLFSDFPLRIKSPQHGTLYYLPSIVTLMSDNLWLMNLGFSKKKKSKIIQFVGYMLFTFRIIGKIAKN